MSLAEEHSSATVGVRLVWHPSLMCPQFHLGWPVSQKSKSRNPTNYEHIIQKTAAAQPPQRDQHKVSQPCWRGPRCCATVIGVDDKQQWAEDQETTGSRVQPQKAKWGGDRRREIEQKHKQSRTTSRFLTSIPQHRCCCKPAAVRWNKTLLAETNSIYSIPLVCFYSHKIPNLQMFLFFIKFGCWL